MDANGNLTARGTDTFGYDQANRLKTASVGGTASAYSYDGDGKRAFKTVAGAPTNYTYDVNASLSVLLDDGTRKYVWGLGLAFAVDASGSPIVYHADGLGSIRALTDSSGTVVQTYLYDEYGNALSSTGSITQPFQYTGEVRDPETGLIYLRARMYDAAMGRFTSRDLPTGKISKPRTLNRYAYAFSNPCTWRDPSGRWASRADQCGAEPTNADGEVIVVPPAVDMGANIRETRAHGGDYAWFIALVKNRGPWDYKRSLGPEWVAFGNFHYGVMGAAFGFSEHIALSRAGAYQQWSNLQTVIGNLTRGRSDPVVQTRGIPFVSDGNGDDPDDQALIQIGYRWYSWYECMNP